MLFVACVCDGVCLMWVWCVYSYETNFVTAGTMGLLIGRMWRAMLYR